MPYEYAVADLQRRLYQDEDAEGCAVCCHQKSSCTHESHKCRPPQNSLSLHVPAGRVGVL